MWSRNNNKFSLGLDIGADSVKLAQLVRDSQVPKLQECIIKKLPEGVIQEGVIKKEEELQEVLELLVTEYDLQGQEVVVAMSGSKLFVKKLNLPQMELEELAEIVIWEAEDYLPFSRQEVVLDYHIIEQKKTEIELLLVAVKKEIVLDYVSLIERVGLQVKAVDIEMLALQRSLLSQENIKDDLILLDLGKDETEFVAFKQGKFVFRRVLSVGGRDFSEEVKVKSEQSINLREARRYKKNQNLFKSGMITNTSITLLKEVKRAIDYFQLKFKNDAPQRITLTGGGAKLKGLKEFLQQKLQLRVGVGKQLAIIDFDSEKFTSHYLRDKFALMAVSLGLALRGLEDD
ncbi:type IV pilus assembly protein PilM [Natroniella sp. ANB-PHB2]|uniref:type IV pilus assembly protein PilM n=1 Tax=Natroniella sp. ANB-PHB2 TaxID=3384444 RepID=UPI0038D43C5C